MSSRRMIFVTTELHPETPGGAGVVVDALAGGLAGDRECVVLLLSPEELTPFERTGVEVVTSSIPASGFLERSRAVAEAVASMASPGDRLEIQDFEGIGYWALSHRADHGIDQCAVTVRFHGPYDLLADVMETSPEDWDLPRAMERESFRMADQVIIPVAGHRRYIEESLGVEPDRVVVSPPPVAPLDTARRVTPPVPTFAVIGRLGEMKGSQDMVRAALNLLADGVEFRVRFIGGDGWSPTSMTGMQQRLQQMIGPEHRDHFEFEGHTGREQLSAYLADVTAVVIPSRFESFCLAAHEARLMGLPVVVPSLAAFTGLFNEATGAVVYDGSVAGLTEALGRLTSDPALAETLESRPAPAPGHPWSAYAEDPAPRHPRSQAGLATAATKRLEMVMAGGRRTGGRVQRFYRYLPVTVARALARLAPGSLKDRMRHTASWPAEEARRSRQARLDAVDRLISAGAFPEVEEPDASVIVPVHDDFRFLEETLASVYEQTHPSWEILLVDDGSTDVACLAYLDKLKRPRLRVLHQDNQGLPAARNLGISRARGRFVVPLDSDDELYPEFLSTMIAALEARPDAAYAHCYARLYHDIDAIWIPRPFNPYWQLLGNGVVGCVLLRREAWEKSGGYDETMRSGNEDWELWLKLMEQGWDQVQVAEVLFKYRKHDVSMSVDTESRFEDGRRMVRDRHPGLYSPSSLADLKKKWYPMITVIGTGGETLPADSELIRSPDELGRSWGKYVVDTRGLTVVDTTVVTELAEALEGQPRAARARTSADPPMLMTRRWNLHDPEAAPDLDLVIEAEQTGPSFSLPDLVPRPGWATPAHLGRELPVQRQPPEEAGHIADPDLW